jgi:hypothetical protein
MSANITSNDLPQYFVTYKKDGGTFEKKLPEIMEEKAEFQVIDYKLLNEGKNLGQRKYNPGVWKKDDTRDYVYLVDQRLVGPLEDIQNYLELVGFDERQIDEILNSEGNIVNYENHSDDSFLDFVKRENELKEYLKKQRPEKMVLLSPEELLSLDISKFELKNKESESGKKMDSIPRRVPGKRVSSLSKRLEKLANQSDDEKKFLDVSNMKDGMNTQTVAMKSTYLGGSKRSNKVGSRKLPMVASIQKRDKYKEALEILLSEDYITEKEANEYLSDFDNYVDEKEKESESRKAPKQKRGGRVLNKK